MSEPFKRTDWVHVETAEGLIRIHWDAREQLLARLQHLDDGKAVVTAFEAAGTTRPVTLTEEGKRLVLETLTLWGMDADLHEGLKELRYALDREFNPGPVHLRPG